MVTTDFTRIRWIIIKIHNTIAISHCDYHSLALQNIHKTHSKIERGYMTLTITHIKKQKGGGVEENQLWTHSDSISTFSSVLFHTTIGDSLLLSYCWTSKTLVTDYIINSCHCKEVVFHLAEKFQVCHFLTGEVQIFQHVMTSGKCLTCDNPTIWHNWLLQPLRCVWAVISYWQYSCYTIQGMEV